MLTTIQIREDGLVGIRLGKVEGIICMPLSATSLFLPLICSDWNGIGPAHNSFYLWNAALVDRARWWAEGLKVIYHRPSRGSEIKSDMGNEDLYKFAFYGHGDGIGSLYASGPAFDNASYLNAGNYTHHGVNLMRLIGCQTHAEASRWRMNVSRNGELVTIEGFLNFFLLPRWQLHSQPGTR